MQGAFQRLPGFKNYLATSAQPPEIYCVRETMATCSKNIEYIMTISKGSTETTQVEWMVKAGLSYSYTLLSTPSNLKVHAIRIKLDNCGLS